MILPQYSLRKLLASMVGFALFCLVVSWGLRGNDWALGVAVAGLSIGVALVVQALFFWIAWLFASLTANRQERRLNRIRASEIDAAGMTASDQPATSGGVA